jgi:hypothetical protein
MAFINGPVPAVVDRLVTATPAAFERDLRAAWPAVSRPAPGRLQLVNGEVCLTLALVILPVRKLGLFELPQLQVSYCFEGGDEPARRHWLAMLDRAMQKGGG